MESRGPTTPRGGVARRAPSATSSRPPQAQDGAVARPSAGPKPSGVAGGGAANNGAGEDPSAKGTARLAGLRLQGGTDASNSIVITAVRQLEQRLESERRHTERQLQRLERQVEELMSVPPSGGRMAELQGYVDGLSESVQTLMRRSEEPTLSARGGLSGITALASPPSDTTALASLSTRLGAMEAQQAKADRLQAKADRVSVPQQDLSAPLAACQEQLRALSGQVGSLAARLEGVERGALQREGANGDRNGVASVQEFCTALASPAGEPKDDSASESDASTGRTPRDDDGVRDDSTNSEGFSVAEQVEEQVAEVCEQVDELHSQLEEQLGGMHERLMDLEGRVQETESNLQDMRLDHDVKQETSHIGEQILRLGMRTQSLERGGVDCTMAVDLEEVRELRGELGDFSEQLLNLTTRLSHAERGLSGIAEAFGRVCEELGQLRSARAPVRSSPGSRLSTYCHEQVEGQEKSLPSSPDGQASSRMSQSLEANEAEALPLEDKVAEMDRNFQSMAEVVWELRKQVTGLRTSFASLQTMVVGEEEGQNE